MSSRGVGVPQSSGVGIWASCQVTAATAAFTTGSFHPGFKSVGRTPAVGAGDFQLVLDDAGQLATAGATVAGGVRTHNLAGGCMSIVQVDAATFRVRTFLAGGALTDLDFDLQVLITSPVG